MTIIRVSYNKNAVNIQIIAQKYVIKPPNFFVSSLLAVKHIQGVTGGTDQTSGECSLGHTIPI